jgi:hypothetical protein
MPTGWKIITFTLSQIIGHLTHCHTTTKCDWSLAHGAYVEQHNSRCFIRRTSKRIQRLLGTWNRSRIYCNEAKVVAKKSEGINADLTREEF